MKIREEENGSLLIRNWLGPTTLGLVLAAVCLGLAYLSLTHKTSVVVHGFAAVFALLGFGFFVFIPRYDQAYINTKSGTVSILQLNCYKVTRFEVSIADIVGTRTEEHITGGQSGCVVLYRLFLLLRNGKEKLFIRWIQQWEFFEMRNLLQSTLELPEETLESEDPAPGSSANQ